MLERLPRIRQANVVIAVAGMDGALPSVAAGLLERPVIAVPTSIGYGASFEGIGPLLTMLSSCAAGVGVVNIDNGFGAGYLAAQINRLAARPPAARNNRPAVSRRLVSDSTFAYSHALPAWESTGVVL